MGIKWHQWVALALLIAAIGIWSRPPSLIFDSKPWRPVQLPLLIRTGEFSTPSFNAGLNETYSIWISGAGGPQDREQRDLGISWVVLQGNTKISYGNSREFGGMSVSSELEREIGKFRAIKGNDYRVLIRMQKDIPEFDVFRPVLKIKGGNYKDALVGHMLEQLIYDWAWRGLAACGIVFLVLGSLFEWRRLRR